MEKNANVLHQHANEFWNSLTVDNVYNCSDNERVIMGEEFSYIDSYGITEEKTPLINWKKDELCKETAKYNRNKGKIKNSLAECGVKVESDLWVVTNVALFALAFPERFRSKNEKLDIYEELVTIRRSNTDLLTKFEEASKFFNRSAAICLSGNTRLAIIRKNGLKLPKKYKVSCFEQVITDPETACNYGSKISALWDKALLGNLDALALIYLLIVRLENVGVRTQSMGRTASFCRKVMDEAINYEQKGNFQNGLIQHLYSLADEYSDFYNRKDIIYNIYCDSINSAAKRAKFKGEKAEATSREYSMLVNLLTDVTSLLASTSNFDQINRLLTSCGFDYNSLRIEDLKTLNKVFVLLEVVKGKKDVSYIATRYEDVWRNHSSLLECAKIICDDYGKNGDQEQINYEKDKKASLRFAEKCSIDDLALTALVFMKNKDLDDIKPFLADLEYLIEEMRAY